MKRKSTEQMKYFNMTLDIGVLFVHQSILGTMKAGYGIVTGTCV